MAKAIKEDGVR
uniref:Uncharacterized protein n=1 Tax=Rhizophora mucronata TaxID=61149 RepID=A0A2P2N4K4_RHIMU